MQRGATSFDLLCALNEIKKRLSLLVDSLKSASSMESTKALSTLLAPISAFIQTLDISSPSDCQSALNERFPICEETLSQIRHLLRAGIETKELAPKEHGGIRFGRLHKANGKNDIGIEIVHMAKAGPGHSHPRGEFDLCFAVDGKPTFDGNPEGWTVYGAQSWHVPTVEGGAMDIIYFLPGGEIRFEAKPE